MQMERKVQISLGPYTSSGCSEGGWSLRIEDQASRVTFLDVLMSHEDMARLLGTQPRTVTAQIRGLDKIGMRVETKGVWVERGKEPIPSCNNGMDKWLLERVRVHRHTTGEVLSKDGWAPDVRRFCQSQLQIEGTKVGVIFERWVKDS